MKGWMKGCRPKEIEKDRCKLYDSQFSKSIKRQVVSYSYTDTLPKGKSREIKNIRIPRPKSLRNERMLIIHKYKRSWSRSDSLSHFSPRLETNRTQKTNKIASLFHWSTFSKNPICEREQKKSWYLQRKYFKNISKLL